jgi:hypothetical protein
MQTLQACVKMSTISVRTEYLRATAIAFNLIDQLLITTHPVADDVCI